MIFDTVVYAFGAIAIIMGFNSGLLRSLATILAYVIAAPVAIAVAPALSRFLAENADLPPSFDGLVLAFVLLVAGMIFGAVLRRTVGDLTGDHIGMMDRLLGAVLGAGRVAFVAVLVVLIFDRVIPADHDPAFLADSRLRPYL